MPVHRVYKGWNATLYKGGIKIGLAGSWSCEVATGLDPYYQIGERVPYALTEGNQEITGSMERVWINNDFVNLAFPSGFLDEFDMQAQTSDQVDAPYIYLYECKIETVGIDIPQDGFITESIDFRARQMSFGLKT